MKKETHKKNIGFRLFCACAFALSMAGCSSSVTEEGLAYLQAQQETDVQALEDQFRAEKEQEMFNAILNGEVDLAAAFSNAVILGDSRAVGFSEYGFLPDSVVLSQIGVDSTAAEQYVSTIQARQPAYIFFAYGMNDLMNNLGGSVEGYEETLEGIADELLAVSPNSKIIFNSILPAQPAAVAQKPALGNADAYNAALQDLCAKRGWTYVDNSSIVSDDSYEGDGIHFKASFYPIWGANMLKSVMAG